MDITALRLAAIVESSDDAIIGKDLDGTITFWNRAAERIFGYAADEAIGQPITLVIPDDGHEEERSVLARISRGEAVRHFETKRRRRDGTVIDVSLTISPIRRGAEGVIGASTIARDITDRKRVDAAFADLHRRLQALIQASSSLLGTPDIEHVSAATIAVARELLTADGYAIWRAEAGTGWRVTKAEGISAEFAAGVVVSYQGAPLADDSGLTEPLVVEDVEAADLLAERLDAYRREGVRSLIVFPLGLAGQRSATLVFYYRTAHTFSEAEIETGRALANLAAAAMATADLYEATERDRRRAAFLADAGGILARSLDYERTLAQVARLAVPDIADWCTVDVARADDTLERVGVAHADPAKLALAERLHEQYPPRRDSPFGIYQVAHSGRPVLIPEITDEVLQEATRDPDHARAVRELGLVSYMCVPLVVHGRTLGVLTFVSARPGRRYAQADLRFAEDIAARAALAIANARAYEEVRRLARDLEATRHRIEQLIESVPGVVWEAWGQPDASSQRIDFVSSYVETMLGYTVEEWLGTPNFWLSIVHPEDRDSAARVAAEAFASGRPHTNRFRWIARDGRVIWVEAHAVVVRDGSGTPIGMRGVTLDVSKGLEAELRFQRVVEAAPTAIIATDARGTIVLVNALTERLFGYTCDELVGRSVELLVPGRFRDGHPGFRAGFVAAPRSRAMGAGRDLYGLRKDGSEVPIEIGLNPIEVDGSVMILSSIVDITERKRAEEERGRLLERERSARAEAVAASRAKDEFLAMVSHELRNPLNAILGYVRLLRMQDPSAGQQARALDIIDRNAVALNQLIEDVLDVSRIVAGRLRLNVQPVRLADVLADAVTTVRPAADARGVRIQTVIDAGVPAVSGDPDRLQQVAWNLLSNAVKFTPRGGRVQLHLQRVNSHVEIVVSDTGQGIEQEFLPHVFERFRQADSRFSRGHGGLGLGLAIVREIVELHGGSVTASSDGVGTGSTFRVRLPLLIIHREEPRETERVHPRHERQASPLTRGVPLDGVRILAVDDEGDARDLLKTVLETAGGRVTTVPSGAAALQALESDVPDVLIADLGMAGMDGLELIRNVRASSSSALRHLPAAALTAYARSEDRVSALGAGFQMHLAKPIDPTELILAIATLARRTVG